MELQSDPDIDHTAGGLGQTDALYDLAGTRQDGCEMSQSKRSKRAGVVYKSVDAEPLPRRAWLEEGWRRPGPPKIPLRVGFGPDYMGDLPVWGVDWQNPPLSRKLLQALVDWQNEFDDHGIDQWPEADWVAWQAEGERLLPWLQRELGPNVTIDATFREK
jgi:hypothetical protein